MKLLQSTIIRALTAIVVGALIIKYREETVQWLTICIGILFLITGLISCAVYFKDKQQTLPIVGMGSIALGVILAVMPTQFITGLTYVLAAMLILGAINEYVSLGRALRFYEIGWFYWLLPSVILIIAILMIINPKQLFTAPLFILGWCMILYGVADCIVAFMTHKANKARQIENQESSEEIRNETQNEIQNETEEVGQAEVQPESTPSESNISFVDEGHEIEIEPE